MTGRRLVSAVLDRLRHPIRHWRSTVALWAIALLAIGAFALWKNYWEDRFFPRNWGVVEEGRIYRSGLLDKRLVKPTLQKYGIRVVISLINEEFDREDQNVERQITAELGIERVVLPLGGDGRGDVRRYAAALETMARARRDGKPVLVHCVAGSNRTGGVIAMWRVLVERKPPADAYAEMADYGASAEDDPELLRFLNENMAELADLLVRKGVIDRAPDPLPHLGP